MFNPESFIQKQLELVSNFGTNRVAVLITIILISFYLYRKKYVIQSLLVIFTTISYPLVWYLKGVFKQPRPTTDGLNIYFLNDIYGFPSGHTLFYTVFFGYLIYLSLKLKRINKFLRRLLMWISVYLLVFIGVSRIALQVHDLGDVIGGYLIGLVVLIIFIQMERLISKS